MPAAGGRRGRRDNGLVATDYAPAGDVDPRIGEHLLDVLAAGGIAAYLQPSTDLHPITRTTSLPARPVDRLFVDRDHLGTARDYMREVTPERDRITAERTPTEREPLEPEALGHEAVAQEPVERERTADDVPGGKPDEPDLETAWREIVAGFHLSFDRSDVPRAGSDEVTLNEPRPLPHIEPPTGTESRTARRSEPAEPSLLDPLDTFNATLPEDDEGYNPPPPPPLPRISAAAGMGVAAIAFGLVLFVWPGLLPMGGNMVLLVAFGSIVAGFTTLIWRLRPGDEDDDPDDGARV